MQPAPVLPPHDQAIRRRLPVRRLFRRQRLLLAMICIPVAALVPLHAEASSVPLPSEHDACLQFQWIFIGKVESKSSRRFYAADDTVRRPNAPIVTDVQLSVERIVHGDVPRTVQITSPGGFLDGEAGPEMSGEPAYTVGSRSLFFLTVHAGASDLMGDKAVRFVFELNPRAELPTNAILQAIWREHCEAPPGRTGAGPTSAFRAYMPKFFLDWCEHYQ